MLASKSATPQQMNVTAAVVKSCEAVWRRRSMNSVIGTPTAITITPTISRMEDTRLC